MTVIPVCPYSPYCGHIHDAHDILDKPAAAGIILLVGPPYHMPAGGVMILKNNYVLLVPPQKTRLHEEIVGQLKDKIISRELEPGSKLPPERDLADTLNVNRSTVREALNKLESMELVEIKHGDGVYVLDYLESGSLELLKQMLFKDGIPDVGIIKNISDLRKILIPEIACHAAMNRSRKDLLELERVVFKSDDMPVDEKDWRVHNIIGRASGNLFFVILLNSFTSLLKNYAFIYFKSDENRRKSVEFHRNIFEALKSRNSQKAREVTLNAYEYAEEAMFKAFQSIQEK